MQYAVLDRVFKFLEKPECVARVAAGQENAADTANELEQMLAKTQGDLKTRREYWMRKARAKAVDDTAKIKRQNDDELAHHIRHITVCFDRRLQVAMRRQQQEEDGTAQEIELFFSQQELRLNNLLSSYVSSSVASNEHMQQQREAEGVMAQVFQPEFTMKLALAAKLLQSPPLDEACLTVVKQNVSQYTAHKEWRSELIAEQYHRELLPTMSAMELAGLLAQNEPKSWLSKHHLENEMKARRKIAEQEMRQMKNDELHPVLQEPSAWPDLVEAELLHRQLSRGSGALNTELTAGQPLKLQNQNSTVMVTQPLRTVAVQGLVKAAAGAWGRPYFEVSLDLIDASAGSTVSIGWDLIRSSLLPAPLPGLTPGEELRGETESFGISLQNDGFLNVQGRTEVVQCSFGENSVVGCGLDLALHRVTYYVDGTALDVTHTSMKASEVRVKPPYCLVPAATMYTATSHSKCQLSFNFTGPFRHEQLVKEHFWEPLADLALKGT